CETAGFAAVGLVNARHFYALEERAHRQAPVKASAACEKKRTSIVQSLTTEVHWLLEYSRQSVQNLAEGGDATLPAEQRQGLLKAGQRISQGERAVDLMAVVCQGSLPSQTAQDLAGLIKHELPAFQRMARQAGKEIASEVPVAPLPVALDAALLKAILAGLVSYALQVSPTRQRLTLQAVPMDAQHAQLRLFTPGVRLENNLFNRPVVSQDLEQRCGPQGLSLAGLKEIAAAAGGKVLIENAAGSEPALILVLPLCESSPH
ncbi:MAG TPA: hypothetical protein VHO48_11860, partial [Anaerolineaceae bacterium]|nr:hypothetical protein [Anaerolineaceae bacterium]